MLARTCPVPQRGGGISETEAFILPEETESSSSAAEEAPTEMDQMEGNKPDDVFLRGKSQCLDGP